MRIQIAGFRAVAEQESLCPSGGLDIGLTGTATEGAERKQNERGGG